jgi:hypothetical protein
MDNFRGASIAYILWSLPMPRYALRGPRQSWRGYGVTEPIILSSYNITSTTPIHSSTYPPISIPICISNLTSLHSTIHPQNVTPHRRPKTTRFIFLQRLSFGKLSLRQHHRDNPRQRALHQTTGSPLPLCKLPKSIRVGGFRQLDHGRGKSGCKG